MVSDVSDQRRVNRTPLRPSRLRRGPVANDHHVCTLGGFYFWTANQGAMLARLSSVGPPLCAVPGVRAMLY